MALVSELYVMFNSMTIQNRKKAFFIGSFISVFIATIGFSCTIILDWYISKLNDEISTLKRTQEKTYQVGLNVISDREQIRDWINHIDVLKQIGADEELIKAKEDVVRLKWRVLAHSAINAALVSTSITEDQEKFLHDEIDKKHFNNIQKKEVISILQASIANTKIPESYRKFILEKLGTMKDILEKDLMDARSKYEKMTEDYLKKVAEGSVSVFQKVENKNQLINTLDSWKFRVFVLSIFLNSIGLLMGFSSEYIDKYKET